MGSVIDPGVFALVGAAATLSGFARMTVSLVVIMFELTGELNYVVPFMCAVLAAKMVGDQFTPSIYDGVAGLLGYANIEEPEGLHFSARCSDLAQACGDMDFIDIAEPMTVQCLKAQLAGHPIQEDTVELRETLGPFGPAELGPTEAHPSPASCKSPRVLLLITRRSGEIPEVHGVVERWRLAEWLRSNGQDDAFCSFKVRGEAEPISPSTLLPLDASGIVVRDFVRFVAHAPVLTAVCAFRLQLGLKYCVCRDETGERPIAVFSREELEEALASGKFTAAFRESRGGPGPKMWAVLPTALSRFLGLAHGGMRFLAHGPAVGGEAAAPPEVLGAPAPPSPRREV